MKVPVSIFFCTCDIGLIKVSRTKRKRPRVVIRKVEIVISTSARKLSLTASTKEKFKETDQTTASVTEADGQYEGVFAKLGYYLVPENLQIELGARK